MNATRQLINRAPNSHTRRYLLLRQYLTNVLHLAHPIKVNVTQPINNHFELFSVQVINDLSHHLVLSHQDKDIVK